ncbi:MAG: amidohydrolase family protein [Actinomycetaceae bacterium]|nr:amidohydrolase family protein [Actinomycetaceae bacterium]MDY6082486.1 amidohydrolase family protein [Actinomycetaceae bacterium]
MTDQLSAIDTHAHIYPERYLDFLESLGVDPATTRIARNMRQDDDPHSMAARLSMMDTAGVTMQVISATPQVPPIDDAANSARAARMINTIYAQVQEKYPERIRALGTLPLPFVDESLAEIAYIFDELHFPGVAMNTFVGADGSLTAPGLRPIFDELNRRHAIVYIHPSGLSLGSHALAGSGLTWVNAAPMEDATALLQLMKAGYIDEFPDIHFHIAHLGGDVPFLAQRIQDNFDDWNAFPHSPAQTLRKIWVDTANFHGPSLTMSLGVYNPEHVMMGSDYPYFQDELYTRAVTYIADALPDSASVPTSSSIVEKGTATRAGAPGTIPGARAREAVLNANARRLYGLN